MATHMYIVAFSIPENKGWSSTGLSLSPEQMFRENVDGSDGNPLCLMDESSCASMSCGRLAHHDICEGLGYIL